MRKHKLIKRAYRILYKYEGVKRDHYYGMTVFGTSVEDARRVVEEKWKHEGTPRCTVLDVILLEGAA
jgi:hypothetical protein